MLKVISFICSAILLASPLAASAEMLDTQVTDPIVVYEGEYRNEDAVSAYDSLSEINEIVGCNLCHPGVMGVTDISYIVYDETDYKMAEYIFEVNGTAYCFRCAPTTDVNIANAPLDLMTAFSVETNADISFTEGEGMKSAQWFTIDGQYALTVNDNGEMAQDTFAGIAAELKDMTDQVMNDAEINAYYDGLSGNYADRVSQRAMATVSNADDGVAIVVSWANSAFEYYEWTMTAKRAEDGLLYYEDCTLTIVDTDDQGIETRTVVSENGSGFFGESEGILYWNGAEDEYCTNCEFEMIAE